MTAAHRVISIGTLAMHPLWGERNERRTGHATTTLLVAGDVHVLVNPGLPPTALLARLGERTSVRADRITHVFLTSFHADHRRGLAALPHAEWLLHEPEREAAAATLRGHLEDAETTGDAELVAQVEADRRVLERTSVAPESLARGIDLFPLPGVTPGTCGLLLPEPARTVLVSGDAVATVEHYEQGKVLPQVADLEQARESFREAVEIADVIVPGRDNVMLNPVRRAMGGVGPPV